MRSGGAALGLETAAGLGPDGRAVERKVGVDEVHGFGTKLSWYEESWYNTKID
jgi:hypothetical protein